MAERKSASKAFENAARELEAEVKKALDYVEANVVPKARKDGEKVLRRLSQELSRWADRLHDEEQSR
jgi:hypothetical protein